MLESPPTWQLNATDPVVNQFHSNSPNRVVPLSAPEPTLPPPPGSLAADSQPIILNPQPVGLNPQPNAIMASTNVDPNAAIADQILEVSSKWLSFFEKLSYINGTGIETKSRRCGHLYSIDVLYSLFLFPLCLFSFVQIA